MRTVALLLSLALLTASTSARADGDAPGTIRLWPVPALALTPGLEVTLDGAPLPLEQLGRPLAVSPGDHVVRVSAPGRVTSETSVTAPSAGTNSFVILDVLTQPPSARVTAPEPKSAPAPAPAPTEGGPPPVRVAGYVLGGVGLATATTGLAIAIAAPTVDGIGTSEEDITTAAWTVTGIGGGALLSGIVMAVVAPDVREPVVGPAVTGWATPQSAGVAFARTF